MAGLLDFFGNGWDDPKSNAVMALAGGLLDGDFASGMKGYANVMAGAGEAKMKKAMQEAQIAKYASDVEMDKQNLTLKQSKEKRDSDFEGLIMERLKRAQLGGGVATPNMPVTGSQSGQGGASSGQSYEDPFAGVNPMAMLLDMRNNSGKKMGDWVNDRTAPKWENINGNLVNTNAPNFQGGFQAGMKASDNGQMSMWQPDGQGGLIVGAPKGALETYSAYRNADEVAKAGFKLEKITLPSGQEVMVPTDQLAKLARGQITAQGGQQPSLAPRAAAGSEAQIIANGMGGLGGLPTTARGGNVSFKSTPAEMDKPRIFQDAYQTAAQQFANAQKMNDIPAMNRAQSDMREIQKELGGGRAPSLAPNQAPQSAPSFGLELQSESQKQRTAAENDAYKTRLVDTAKADVTRESGLKADEKRFSKFGAGVDEARSLLKGGATASGIGSIVDAGLGFIGQSTKSADAAAKLDTLSSNMTMEVPRMEGPQSDGDRKEYKVAAGMVGDRTKPISQRLAALDVIEKMHGKYADLNGGGKLKQEAKSLQEYGYKSNDDVLRDARNTIMRNPQSKAEVERRLQSMGLSLGGR